MKKYDTFLSYQFTGIDPQVRTENILLVTKQLESEGKVVFCSDALEPEFQAKGMSADQIYTECLKIQSQQTFEEIVFYFMDPRESKGMKLELEKAIQLGQKGRIIIKEGLEDNGELEWIKPFKQFCGVETVEHAREVKFQK